jgi:hypothetical protein
METAKPIPVIGSAGWDHYEHLRHTHDPNEEFEAIFLQVPGFENVPLYAVEIIDDHADAYYEQGRYIVWTSRDYAGLRDGDNVVVVARPRDQADKGVSLTIRQLKMGRRRSRKAAGLDAYFANIGGLLSLSLDREKYPNYQFLRAGETRPEPSLEVIGVVVADLNFEIRPPSPGMFPKVEGDIQKFDWEQWVDKNPEAAADPVKWAKDHPEVIAPEQLAAIMKWDEGPNAEDDSGEETT